MNGSVALYIHVPFCRSKCRYCSFASYAKREADIPAYLKSLKKELKRRGGGQLRSIYFGGGTPSLLSASQIGELIEAINTLFIIQKSAEITIEANPGTISTDYLKDIRKAGVNRLSLGVQSLSDGELKMLGRIHTAAEAIQAVNMAREAGFDNLSLDLIYGLPGQTLGNWRETLHQTLQLAPEHLSLYGLTMEEGTALWGDIKNKSLPEIDPDLAADQYELAEDLLSAHGYGHYEISNWALPGRECRHNLTYWQNLPYIGIGAAAHSFSDGHRTANSSNLDEYLAGFSGGRELLPEMDEALGRETQLAETIILGLRLEEGIDAEQIGHRFGVDLLSCYQPQIAEMTRDGLMEQKGGRMKLTRRGRLLSNEVFWRFLPA